MTSNELIFSQEGPQARITLNRADAHNALTQAMWDGIPRLLRKAKENAAQVVVITGSGSSFASGADLVELSEIDNYATAERIWKSIKSCLDFVWSFELPTIAMINGPCIGGGCLLAIACDLRLALSTATFGIPVARLGIILDDDNVSRLVNLVGAGVARELLYVGDTISSGRAVSCGLINQALKPGVLEEVVAMQAEQICKNAAITVRSAKQSINRSIGPADPGFTGQEAVVESYLSAEFRTRIARYLKNSG